MSKILNHINQNGFDAQEWADRGVSVKQEGPLLLFKYSNIMADFKNPLVREARGLILREEEGKFEIVSRPFDKFFNTTETRCEYGPDKLNELLAESPERVQVVEKADGTCIQVWYDKDQLDWRASTLGTITPGSVSVGVETFDVMFWRTIGLQSVEERANAFKRGHTYVFELCRPENMIVTMYPEPRVYILGCRSLGGDVAPKSAYKHLPGSVWHPVMWDAPKNYDELAALVDSLPERDELGTNPEGIVVYVDDCPVAKVKNDRYLTLHRIGGGDYPAAMNRIKDAVFDDTYHDFKDDLSPMLRNYLDRMVRARQSFIGKAVRYNRGLIQRFAALKEKSRKELAKLVKSYPEEYSAVLFKMNHLVFDQEEAEKAVAAWLVDKNRHRKLPQFKLPLEETQ